jgi:hypothetical protein
MPTARSPTAAAKIRRRNFKTPAKNRAIVHLITWLDFYVGADDKDCVWGLRF